MLDEPNQQIDRDQKDCEYRREYLGWVASLPPADRSALLAQGLDRPKVERTAFSYIRPEVFRESAAQVGMPHDPTEGIDTSHPMDNIEPEEEREDIDTDDLEKLGRCNPEVLQVLMRVVFFADLGRGPQLKASFARMVAVAHALHIPGIGERSLTDIAAEIGVTRALLSHYATRVRDFAKLDHAAGKSLEGREAYRVAQIWRYKNPEARRRKNKGAAPGDTHEKITEGAI